MGGRVHACMCFVPLHRGVHAWGGWVHAACMHVFLCCPEAAGGLSLSLEDWSSKKRQKARPKCREQVPLPPPR